MPILRSIEAQQLIPHCLEFRTRMPHSTLADTHMGAQMIEQFPHAHIMGFAWRQVFSDFPPPDKSTASIDELLQHFIAAHCDENDGADLIDQLRTTNKPRWLFIGSRRQQYEQICSYPYVYVKWFPGTAATLTADKQHQAFLHGYPDA